MSHRGAAAVKSVARVDLLKGPEHYRWAGSTPLRRGAASEGSQGLSEATPLEKERRPEFVPRQRHWKRSLIGNCAQVLLPLTRHEFKSRCESRGARKKRSHPSLPSEAAPRRCGPEPVTPLSLTTSEGDPEESESDLEKQESTLKSQGPTLKGQGLIPWKVRV